MKKLFYAIFLTWTIYMCWPGNQKALQVAGQYWNISQVFEPITFDPVHRGSFNLSQCSREYLNCWDIFPHTGAVCSLGEMPGTNISKRIEFDSICGLMRNYCTEYNPIIDVEYPAYAHEVEANQDVYLGEKQALDINYEACMAGEFGNSYWT